MNTDIKHRQLVFTVKDRCRMCFTCVRECPAKAIRIMNGQAEVVSERCIGCGNCIKVCNQGAKVFLETSDVVNELLNKDHLVFAILAPSFPAEFKELSNPAAIAGMIRALGFDKVIEVSFGADLVAKEYSKLLKNRHGKNYISSDCPAIVRYIEYYHPELTKSLAPIVSPMTATARMIKKTYGKDVKIVFVGPCIAKKAESNEIDEAITFRELRGMLEQAGINEQKDGNGGFDAPTSGKGAIFPVSRGLLQTTDHDDDICHGNVLVAEGKENFREAIKEFENGVIRDQHLELLCCDGCIMGPGLSCGGKKFERTLRVSNYARIKLEQLDGDEWKKNMMKYDKLDLSREFIAEDRRVAEPDKDKIRAILHSMGKYNDNDHLNCGACGYETCREHAIAIFEGLAEDEMCLPFTIEKLHRSVAELNLSNEELANTQQALRHSEKLAHMGQLSAGIAHELNNPLGVITMYSNILKDETSKENPVYKDLELIVEQTERCKHIVGGLLNFARKNQVRLQETDLKEFLSDSISSIIHDRNVKVSFRVETDHLTASIDREQMMQVLTNLEKNAVEAMPEGGELGIRLEGNDHSVKIMISDTGHGIPEKHMDKLFTPFFTTKEVGKGTGLGLPLVYGIVKMHKGKISVDSNADPAKGQTGTTFTITLPRGK
ncbi:MAG: [Fe-Fe] hydrogenase large subunit C-terminal domain-containing protein [Bacteroidales bacterium]|nr:[Fe-Fe] hydrogenase large subunit C-terminal domain-containing protein [Bacteroidales bacterium]